MLCFLVGRRVSCFKVVHPKLCFFIVVLCLFWQKGASVVEVEQTGFPVSATRKPERTERVAYGIGSVSLQYLARCIVPLI